VRAEEAGSLIHAGARPGGIALARPRLVAALALVAWLAWAIGLHPLTLPEEGRYVGVAWEMLRSGDWIVPTENGLPFFHKPPLFYWLTAASMQIFGPNAAAARFAPLLGACLAALGFWTTTRRHAGAAVADAAMLVLATMPFFFVAAQFANLDMLVAGFIVLAIVFAADAALALRAGKPTGRAIVLAWACMGLGVMAKGLIGIVLPGLVIGVWLVVSRQARSIPRLLSPLGIAAFALIVVPWFIAVQQQYPGFARYFFIHHHFERFVATGFNNARSWWFYLVAVPLLTLPWSLWLVRARLRDTTGEDTDRRAWRRLMWIWLGVVVVFFSLPRSKPIGYAMPVLFPLAFLVAEPALAAWRRARPGRRRAVVASVVGAVALCLGAVGGGALRYDRDNTALAHTLARLRAPGDPIVFLDEYFFDIPLHARLGAPVPVIADWSDPRIAQHDNWRRELAEAAPFEPARGAELLVDAERGFALRCGKAPLWVVVKVRDEAVLADQPGAKRVATSNRASIWRLGPLACPAAPDSGPAP
jgi:4-amino-4-deoxy-L-arabinose transferase-like glycosyltransferase